jgi:uncharacterized LabA/DUF88 family protein
MDRVAVFVDAGYLFKQGGDALTGNKLTRGQLTLDIPAAVTAFREFAERVSGLPLLRIYWYDGTSAGPSSVHVALGFHAHVKIRLGIVNSAGEQQGVDSLVVTDMINLARNRAMADAVLLTGDEDLRVGVQQAQEHGVRVHLLGIAPARGSVSTWLMQEADCWYEWGANELSRFLRPTVDVESIRLDVGPASSDKDLLRAIATAVVATLDATVLSPLRAAYARGDKQVPRDLDRVLLLQAEHRLGRELVFDDKVVLRGAFIEAVIAAS